MQSQTLIKLTQKMLDEGAAQAEHWGYRWDNSHPTYREINEAFQSNDLARAKACWVANFT